MARAVLYAADAAGHLADPATTDGGGPFSCLECQEPVSLKREHLRQGRVVVAHFSHQPGSTWAGANANTIGCREDTTVYFTPAWLPTNLRRPCAVGAGLFPIPLSTGSSGPDTAPQRSSLNECDFYYKGLKCGSSVRGGL